MHPAVAHCSVLPKRITPRRLVSSVRLVVSLPCCLVAPSPRRLGRYRFVVRVVLVVVASAVATGTGTSAPCGVFPFRGGSPPARAPRSDKLRVVSPIYPALVD